MNIKKYVPNALTLLNLLSGLLALISVFNGFYDHAFYFVCLGIFFDFWDGFFARLLDVKSELGLQLDSLADMVTSGVVPGLLVFKLIENIQLNQDQYNVTEETFYMGVVPYLGFIITLASCYRLAKFNIDTRQTNSFIGLPTPANALFIMSIPMIQYFERYEWLNILLDNPYVLVFITLLSAFLLNAEIPLFSLKLSGFSWDKIKFHLIFFTYIILLLFFFGFVGLPIIIISYILISLLINSRASKVDGNS